MFKLQTKFSSILIASAIASTAAIGTAWAGTDDTQDFQEWLNKAESTLAENMRYPSTVGRHIPEGTVQTRVTIDQNGEISSYQVTKSSGSSSIDREAKALMKRIDAFPAPDFHASESTAFNVDLNYVASASSSDYATLKSQNKNKGRVTTRRVASKDQAPKMASIEIVEGNDG